MNKVGFVIQQRPYPPEWIFARDTPNFAHAPELWRWVKSIFSISNTSYLTLIMLIWDHSTIHRLS